MSEKTGIEWTDHTFNPWIGCTKVSPGCKNCYAETLDTRYYGGTHWGKGAPRKRTSESTWKNPVKWNDAPMIWDSSRPTHGPARIFPSLCDWLDDEVPIEWLADFLKLIHDTPNLDWLLLTKRPENWNERIHQAMRDIDDETDEWLSGWLDCIDMPERGAFPENVWVGVSVEDQKRADERIPLLLQIPAKVRFLSVEPLLESVNLKLGRPICHCGDYVKGGCHDNHTPVPMPDFDCENPEWIIVGGESGKDRRDCNTAAICGVAQQCMDAGVPVFVKQDSAFKPGQRGNLPDWCWALKQFPQLPDMTHIRPEREED